MNRDEFIGKLNALYTGDKNCMEELITTYDELNNKLKKIYEIVHYNCYYPELENYSNDLDDDDIKEIIELLKGFED